MERLTDKKKLILWYLAGRTTATPTEIGEGCGKDYAVASSWACSGLKGLIRDGFVKRIDADASYEITDVGRSVAAQEDNL